MQARASANVKGVHAILNSIMIRHVQPVLDVHVNSVTTPGYGAFNSKTNTIFDPMITKATKLASLDLNPVTCIAPEIVCALSNPFSYHLSEFGHLVNAPHFDLTRLG